MSLTVDYSGWGVARFFVTDKSFMSRTMFSIPTSVSDHFYGCYSVIHEVLKFAAIAS